MPTPRAQGDETDAPPLIPPMPAWRREVQDRVDAYRARRPRTGVSGPLRSPIRVLPFRSQPVAVEPSRSSEPLADPVSPPSGAAEATPATAPSAGPVAVVALVHAHQGDAACLQLPLPMAAGADAAPAPLLSRTLAPCGQRLQAAMIDTIVVAAAVALFVLAGWASQGFLLLPAPPWRPLLPALLGVPALLAAFYLLLCAYAAEGATVGMRCCGLELAGLDGPLTAGARRRRGWASVVSLAALGLGFAWMWCDPQRLSWHDMISRTCVIVAANPENDTITA